MRLRSACCHCFASHSLCITPIVAYILLSISHLERSQQPSWRVLAAGLFSAEKKELSRLSGARQEESRRKQRRRDYGESICSPCQTHTKHLPHTTKRPCKWSDYLPRGDSCESVARSCRTSAKEVRRARILRVRASRTDSPVSNEQNGMQRSHTVSAWSTGGGGSMGMDGADGAPDDTFAAYNSSAGPQRRQLRSRAALSTASPTQARPYDRPKQTGNAKSAQDKDLNGFVTPRRPVGSGSQPASASASPVRSVATPANARGSTSSAAPATTGRGGLLSSVTRLLPRPFSWFGGAASQASPASTSVSNDSSFSNKSPEQASPPAPVVERKEAFSSKAEGPAPSFRGPRTSLGSALARSGTMASELSSRPTLTTQRSALGAGLGRERSGTPRAQGVQRITTSNSTHSARPGFGNGSLTPNRMLGDGASSSAVSASPSRASRFSTTGMSGSQSFAFGFGSERRIGGLTGLSTNVPSPRPAFGAPASAAGGLTSSASISAGLYGAGVRASPGSVAGSTLSAARRAHFQPPIPGSSFAGGASGVDGSVSAGAVTRSPLSRRIPRSNLAGGAASPLGATAANGAFYAGSEAGGAARMGSPVRPGAYAGSAFGGSRSGSVYGPMPGGAASLHSGSAVTPARRRAFQQSWNQLNLRPTGMSAAGGPRESEGEAMMREYATAAEARNGAESDEEMTLDGPVGGAGSALGTPASLGKRARDQSVGYDDDGVVSRYFQSNRQEQ